MSPECLGLRQPKRSRRSGRGSGNEGAKEGEGGREGGGGRGRGTC